MGLSRADWAEAGLAALVEQGFTAVAVEPLARRLGATKGSFYWHFADRAALIAATLELWEQRETTELIASVRQLGEPRDRLSALAQLAYTGAARGNAHAAVVAAASDPHVGAVLARVTRTRLAFLTELYADLGLGPDDAARHAQLAYAVYLGIAELRQANVEYDPGARALDGLADLAVRLLVPVVAGGGATGTPQPRP